MRSGCLTRVFSGGQGRGRNCYVTLVFPGVPKAKRGEKVRSGYLTPMFLEAQKRPELLRNTCNLGGPERQGGGGRKVTASPPPCRGPEEGGFTALPQHSRGTPTPSAGKKSEVATSPLFS